MNSLIVALMELTWIAPFCHVFFAGISPFRAGGFTVHDGITPIGDHHVTIGIENPGYVLNNHAVCWLVTEILVTPIVNATYNLAYYTMI